MKKVSSERQVYHRSHVNEDMVALAAPIVLEVVAICAMIVIV